MTDKNKLKAIILLGLILRIFLMFVGFHDDLRAIVFGGFLAVKQGRLLSFYDFLPNLDPADKILSIFPTYLFNYPPLAYIIPGVFIFLFSPLINFEFLNQYIFNARQYLGTSQLMTHLFILKLPYLFFDLATAYFLSRLFSEEKQRKALIIWLFNPLALYASFAMGQLDILPLFFIILSLYFTLKKGNNNLASAMLGIGGVFKLFPLLLIPIYALTMRKEFWQRLKLIFVGLGSYALFVLPYFLTSAGYRQNALLASQTDKMFYMKLPVTAAEGLPLFSLVYFMIFLWAYFRKGVFSSKDPGLWIGGFAVLGLFFSLTHYHPQWFLWFTPFLIWYWLKFSRKAHLPIILIFVSFLAHLVFFEPDLHIGMFSGGFKQLADYEPIKALFTFPASFWRNNFRAVSAASIIYLYSLVKSKSFKTIDDGNK